MAGAIAANLRSLFRGLKLPKLANGRLTLPAISLSVGSKLELLSTLRAESLPNFRILPGKLTYSVYVAHAHAIYSVHDNTQQYNNITPRVMHFSALIAKAFTLQPDVAVVYISVRHKSITPMFVAYGICTNVHI